MVIVGPENHGRLGDRAWVCYDHWLLSVSTDQKDDEDCEVAALESESQSLFEASPVLQTRTSLRKEARKKLDFGKSPEKPVLNKE